MFPLLCTCIYSLFIHRVSICSAFCLESTHTDVYWTFPTQDGCCCGLPPTHWMVHLRAVSDLVLCCRCPTPPPSCKGWCVGMDAIQEVTAKGIHGDRGERVMRNYTSISVEHCLGITAYNRHEHAFGPPKPCLKIPEEVSDSQFLRRPRNSLSGRLEAFTETAGPSPRSSLISPSVS